MDATKQLGCKHLIREKIIFNLTTLFHICNLLFQAHAKALETRNAQLVRENERLVAQNEELRSDANTKGGQEVNSPLVVRQSPESAEPTNDPQQQEQGCRLLAGGPLTSTASLVTASKLLLNVIKANRRQKKLPIKKRARWPT